MFLDYAEFDCQWNLTFNTHWMIILNMKYLFQCNEHKTAVMDNEVTHTHTHTHKHIYIYIYIWFFREQNLGKKYWQCWWQHENNVFEPKTCSTKWHNNQTEVSSCLTATFWAI